MKPLVSKLIFILRQLLPDMRDKRRFVLFTTIASSSAVLELGIAKLFSEIVTGEQEQLRNIILLVFVFLSLSVIAKIGVYFQKTRRIEVFSEAQYDQKKTQKGNSWNISLGIESSNVTNHLVQIVMIVLFITSLSPLFGLITSLNVLIIISVLNSLFVKQERFQRKILVASYRKEVIDNGQKISSRVKSGEIGALLANFAMILNLVLLVALHSMDWISTPDTIVCFFAIRLLGTNLSSLSSSLMRFARAMVSSSLRKDLVSTRSSSEGSLLA